MREPCFQDSISDVFHILSRFQTVMARNMSYKSVSHPIYGMITPIYFTIEITGQVPFTPFFSRFPRCFFLRHIPGVTSRLPCGEVRVEGQMPTLPLRPRREREGMEIRRCTVTVMARNTSYKML